MNQQIWAWKQALALERKGKAESVHTAKHWVELEENLYCQYSVDHYLSCDDCCTICGQASKQPRLNCQCWSPCSVSCTDVYKNTTRCSKFAARVQPRRARASSMPAACTDKASTARIRKRLLRRISAHPAVQPPAQTLLEKPSLLASPLALNPAMPHSTESPGICCHLCFGKHP